MCMYSLDDKGEKIEVLTLNLHQKKTAQNHIWSSDFQGLS